MASLKDLKVRIASVKSTQKITRAMKMVAAAKLRRAQERAEAARPYAERMEAVLAGLGARMGAAAGSVPLLAGTGSDRRHLLVVITAERGLCGGFNTNIVRQARRRIAELEAAGKSVELLLVGRKGRAQLQRTNRSQIIETIDLSGERTIGFDVAQRLAADLVERFRSGAFDVATLVYSEFRSALVQNPVARQLIPAALPAGAADGQSAVVEYEPDAETILSDLLPRNLAVQIYRALLEGQAGFFGAQMTAMDNATRNAGDMINRLTLTYNRTRQAAITKELIEIISGAEAL
jgi:F-type H+-transporting ATPase subunit gamma